MNTISSITANYDLQLLATCVCNLAQTPSDKAYQQQTGTIARLTKQHSHPSRARQFRT
ncbi:hypothetical protein [Pseudomonas akapageensis]|uniref:hypothetical protein n=1 Tax=Pseudomonas akapageensis TaxID=2609961 RepID=UPI00140A2B5B|nr:hypothetical protein [Pseudomonas akapageensis]